MNRFAKTTYNLDRREYVFVEDTKVLCNSLA